MREVCVYTERVECAQAWIRSIRQSVGRLLEGSYLNEPNIARLELLHLCSRMQRSGRPTTQRTGTFFFVVM